MNTEAGAFQNAHHRIYSSISPIRWCCVAAGGWRRGCKFHGAPAFLAACLRKCHVVENASPLPPRPIPSELVDRYVFSAFNLSRGSRRMVDEYVRHKLKFLVLSLVTNIDVITVNTGVLHIVSTAEYC